MAECPIKTTNVLGKKYQIKRDANAGDDNGVCVALQCVVKYDPQQNEQQLQDTIWHELMHALFYETGLAAEIEDLDDKLEEKIVRRLSTAQLDMIRRNKKLIDYITS